LGNYVANLGHYFRFYIVRHLWQWECFVNNEQFDITEMVYKYLPNIEHMAPIQRIYESRLQARKQVGNEVQYWQEWQGRMDWQLFQHIKSFSFDLQGTFYHLFTTYHIPVTACFNFIYFCFCKGVPVGKYNVVIQGKLRSTNTVLVSDAIRFQRQEK